MHETAKLSQEEFGGQLGDVDVSDTCELELDRSGCRMLNEMQMMLNYFSFNVAQQSKLFLFSSSL